MTSKIRKSQENIGFKAKQKESSVGAPKKQKIGRTESNNRYLSVGFNNQYNDNQGDFISNCSNTLGVGSGGFSTAEDTKSNSNHGAFKKSDASFTLTDFQTTKNSNEANEKENNIITCNPTVGGTTLRGNRLGDLTDKRRLYQSQHNGNNPMKRSTEFSTSNPEYRNQGKFVLPTISTSRKFTQSNLNADANN